MSGGLHSDLAPASPWIKRFAALVPAGASVLDVACGAGRHARVFAERGALVEAADRSAESLALLADVANVTPVQVDLESPKWPYAGRTFDVVVVTNYLYRPHFEALLQSVAPGGVLIYETFMLGNERFGKPSNPDFLLQPGELLERMAGEFTVLAFEQGELSSPKPAMVQRICARRSQSEILPLLP